MRRLILGALVMLGLLASGAFTRGISADGPQLPAPTIVNGVKTWRVTDLDHTPGVAKAVVATAAGRAPAGPPAGLTADRGTYATDDFSQVGVDWLYTHSSIGYYYYVQSGNYICTFGQAYAYTNNSSYVTVGDQLFFSFQPVGGFPYSSSSGASGYASVVGGCYYQQLGSLAMNDGVSSAYFLDGQQLSDTSVAYWARTIY